MKASIVGLVVSTAVFGASTVYFWQQFSEARAQADEVADANRRLNARVAELEKAREQFMSRRMGPPGGGPFEAGGAASRNPPAAPDTATAVADVVGGKDEDGRSSRVPFGGPRAQMPPSMVKAMRRQMRAQNKRTYFDLGQRLGLGQEDADKLLDLITEQQTASFDHARDPNDFGGGPSNEWQRTESQIAELLGPVKAAQYADYKKEMPARMEVSMLAQQFESSEAPLSDAQRTRLITAMSEERDRVPVPDYSNAASPEQFGKDYSAWQADYDQRMTERARSILNTEQQRVYDEYQQFQRDMHTQLSAEGRRMPPPGGVATMIGPAMRARAAPRERAGN